MQSWIISSVFGAALGFALYACVRLRMRFGPGLRERYGEWARLCLWFVTILAMIGLANLGLVALRTTLSRLRPPVASLAAEIWFSLLALIVALALIYQRLRHNIRGD